MKLPGPDHPITIAANPRRVRVTADGTNVTMTTTDISTDPLPAGTFDIPAGYTKSEGGMMPGMMWASG